MINSFRGIGIFGATGQGFDSNRLSSKGILIADVDSSLPLSLGGYDAATASDAANTLVGDNFVLHYGCILCQNGYARLLGGTIHLLARAEAVPSTNLLVLT